MTSLSGGFYTEQEHVRRSETIWIGDALLHTSDTSTLPFVAPEERYRDLLIPLRIWEGRTITSARSLLPCLSGFTSRDAICPINPGVFA